jgi:LemA protein
MGPLLVVVIILVVLFLVFIGMYNGLVGLKQQTQNAFSQIDVQLKRRYDLIPNLVETAKGYMKYEGDTLERVIQARNRAVNATTVGEKAAAEGQVSSALANVFALSEAYPDLKANEQMQSLMEELKSTENKIAFARQYYNDIVTTYNTKLQTFPSSIMAGIGGFKPREMFELENTAERDPVKVQF